MIKASYVFVILAALSCGCVSERSCQLKNASDETYLTLTKDWYGIVPGICGFSTHSSISYVFELPDHKSEYVGSEIREIAQEVSYYTNSYDGAISVDRAQKRVIVKLRQSGHAFELNGRYEYESPSNTSPAHPAAD